MKRRHILCDIDHTISNAFYRDVMMAAPMGAAASWDEYHQASWLDDPLEDMVNLINSLRPIYNIVGLTARPGKWRQLTMDWLVRHNVNFDELLMRPDDDFRKAPDLKVELALARFPNIVDEVAFVFDDREDVIAAFKALGVTALQVHGRQR